MFPKFAKFLAPALALVLSMSVLAVVASTPAGAANTAIEALVDHDQNAETTSIREFAGQDRYATSLAAARGFIRASGGFVDQVVVASGEALVDASAAVGLAASLGAPVLLTPRDSLPSALATFIDDSFISDVYIVGGTSAVSAAVAESLEDLPSVNEVERLAGADRYETSAVVAAELGEPGLYCTTGQAAAVLVNVDSSFADIVAVGPLAFALGLPVLLTQANALPSSVAAYIEDQEIDRLIIIGGPQAVSQSVEEDALDVGVRDFERLAGDNRFGTAVEILEALRGCSTIALSPTSVALINGNSAADGVSAGPLLGLGLDNRNGITPALLVSRDSVPAETRDYLSSTVTADAAGSFTNLSITAIGGETVIPAAVMNAAIAAATTSSDITASISFSQTRSENSIRVSFSEPVNQTQRTDDNALTTAWATSALNPANYAISGGALSSLDEILPSGPTSQAVRLDVLDTLENGDTIELLANRVSGANVDARRVLGALHTVRLGTDNASPQVSVIAAAGGHEIRVVATDPGLGQGETIGIESFDLAGVLLNGDPLPISEYALSYSAPSRTRVPVTGTGTGLPSLDNGRTTAVNPVNQRDFTPEDARRYPAAAREFLSQFIAESLRNDGEYVICLFGREAPDDATSRCRETPPSMPPTIRTAVARNRVTVVENPGDRDATGARVGTTYSSFRPTRNVASSAFVNGITPRLLQAGDRITIQAGTITDAAGNASRTTTSRVGSNSSRGLALTRATVSAPYVYDTNGPTAAGGEQSAFWQWGFVGRETYLPIKLLRLEANSEGAAAGAAGNAWTVLFVQRPADQDPNPAVAEVAVDVIENRRLIEVIFDEGATILAAALALRNNPVVAASFNVTSDLLEETGPTFQGVAETIDQAAERYIRQLPLSLAQTYCPELAAPDCAFVDQERTVPLETVNGVRDVSVGAELGQPPSTRFNLTGGMSAVRVSLTYNDVLESFSYSDEPLTTSSLVGANQAATNFPATEGWGRPARLLRVLAGGDATISINPAGVEALITAIPYLTRTVSFELFSANSRALPSSGNTISLPAGIATSYAVANNASAADSRTLRAG